MSDWQKTRALLDETDAPSTKTPTLHKQQDPGAASARGPPGLDQHYRFKHLVELNIVSNWPTRC